MNRKTASSIVTFTRTALFLFILATLAAQVATAQQPSAAPAVETKTTDKTAAPSKPDERAEKVLQQAIEAAGGSAFLNVQTVVSRGYFTQFLDGKSGPLTSFTDYLAFPDRERTEFKTEGVRSVQTNTGDKGWLFDGMLKKVSDMKPEQVKDFQVAMRTSIDNILRGWWRKEGAQLSYVGRREGGLAKRNDAVRLTYPDGFIVEFEFGAKDGLPYKTLYKRLNKDGDVVEEEDRHAKHLTVSSVTMPFVIDHFRAGAHTSRINYETVEFNRPLPDALFTRPSDVKSVLKTLK
ncbi:MAG TPA: hypothetical protein VF666_21270 [Pyrinomonadaceae bacterium]|jgi:hypothetical protein